MLEVLADIENHHLALWRDISDDDVTEVLRRAIKRRTESVESFVINRIAREELGTAT